MNTNRNRFYMNFYNEIDKETIDNERIQNEDDKHSERIEMKSMYEEGEFFIGGKKIELSGCNTYRYGDSGVSDDSVVYNFYCEILKVSIHLFKDSEEGRIFKEWIENEVNQNRKSVERKAVELILPLLTVDDFWGIIDKEKESSWNEGYRKAQYDIRAALGLQGRNFI